MFVRKPYVRNLAKIPVLKLRVGEESLSLIEDNRLPGDRGKKSEWLPAS